VKELVPSPRPITQEFLKPSARPHQQVWADLEKLLIVVLLYHSNSLSLVEELGDVTVPNLRSSGGAFQYGPGGKIPAKQEEDLFLVEQLTLVGQQVKDLLMWLRVRVHGEQGA
jgi:hypothetical protein